MSLPNGAAGPSMTWKWSTCGWMESTSRLVLAKEGARHHSYAGQRGYHPLLAIAAETGDVLLARLREGLRQHRSGRRPFPA